MSGPKSAIPALPIDDSFLKRTAVATVVTALLIALFSSAYYSLAWGGRYLLMALWASVFFALTGMIFKSMLFERNRAKGFVYIALKMMVLASIFLIVTAWPLPEGEGQRPHALAMIAGVSTPLLVMVLRVGGLAMSSQRSVAGGEARVEESPPKPMNSNPPDGELKSHS